MLMRHPSILQDKDRMAARKCGCAICIFWHAVVLFKW